MSWSRKQICQELKRIFNGQFLNIIGSDKPLNIQVLEDNENFDVYSLKSDWGKAGKDYKLWLYGKNLAGGSLITVCMVLTKKLARELQNYCIGDFVVTFMKKESTEKYPFVRLELLSTGKQTLQEI